MGRDAALATPVTRSRGPKPPKRVVAPMGRSRARAAPRRRKLPRIVMQFAPPMVAISSGARVKFLTIRAPALRAP
jgi:hypothetical protein